MLEIYLCLYLSTYLLNICAIYHSSSSLHGMLLLDSKSVDVVRRAFLQIPKSVELNEADASWSSGIKFGNNLSHCFGIEMSK